LLEGCFDNKFEIRFRTQRLKAEGRGMVDDFDIEVRNKNLDRICLVRWETPRLCRGGSQSLTDTAVRGWRAYHDANCRMRLAG
jgi:hypothetical protein